MKRVGSKHNGPRCALCGYPYISTESAMKRLAKTKSGVLMGPCCTSKFETVEGRTTQVRWSTAEVGAAAGCRPDSKGRVHVEAAIFADEEGLAKAHDGHIPLSEQISRASRSWKKMLENPIRETRSGETVDLFKKFTECLKEAGEKSLPINASQIRDEHIEKAYEGFSAYLNGREDKLGFKRSTYHFSEADAKRFIEMKVVAREAGDWKENEAIVRSIFEKNLKLNKVLAAYNAETDKMLEALRNNANVVDRGIAVTQLLKARRISSVEAKKEADDLAAIALAPKTSASNAPRVNYDALIAGFDAYPKESLKNPQIAAFVAKLKAEKEAKMSSESVSDDATRHQAAFTALLAYKTLLRNQARLKKLDDAAIHDIRKKCSDLREFISEEFGTDIDPSVRLNLKNTDKKRVYGTLDEMLHNDPVRYKRNIVLLSEGVIARTSQDALDRRAMEYREGRFSETQEDTWAKNHKKGA